MRTNSPLNGGVRFYVSVLPALFPSFVFVLLSPSLNAPKLNGADIKVTTMVEKVREVYTSQIGVREKLSNSGPQVEKYLKYVHLPKDNPWCAAFVCWVFGQAGVENPRSGWSPDLFQSTKVIWRKVPAIPAAVAAVTLRDPRPSRGRAVYPSRPITDYRLLITHSSSIKTPLPNPPTPTTGDIFGLYFPEKKRIAHVGFIDQWDGTWLISVEGNTNVSGSREGDGVYRKRRLVRSVYKVARYIE